MASLPQAYRLLRFALKKRKSLWEKLLIIAQFLDRLEEDYQTAFPGEVAPMEGGYEAALRKLFDDKIKS